MTLRLTDIGARIAGVEQLSAVVNAMRGIAAARAQQARNQVAAVDAYSATIVAQVGRALTLMPAPPLMAPTSSRPSLVVFTAEQGFAGAFSEHVFDALGDDLAAARLFLIGTRGAAVLAQRDIAPAWSAAMPSHSGGIPKLADLVSTALYAVIAGGEIDRLEIVFSEWEAGHSAQIKRLPLFPLDLAKFANPAKATPPLHNLPPAALLEGLTADYLHAQLCHAALHAFAAENEARMTAMSAARDQIGRQLATLQASERQVRQEEITAEVIELAAGAAANRG
jgi:F-type H+-transporting ATPase subunit gamma